jgi:hypothetical protein
MFEVASKIEKKLQSALGKVDEKSITAYTERFVFHLKDNFTSRQ